MGSSCPLSWFLRRLHDPLPLCTYGSQFAPTASPPEHCPICEDERQYVGHSGQQWTTLVALSHTHHNRVKQQEARLYSIGTEPTFAIG